jgi:CheY-like chemotaxis protein
MKSFSKTQFDFDPLWIEGGFGSRFQGFQNLMRQRIRDVLLVSSLYDLYLFEEDGRLYELIRNEYHDLYISHAPEITRVSSGEEALKLVSEEKRFDLLITTLHIEDMHALKFAHRVRNAGVEIPIILLAYDDRELNELVLHHDVSPFTKIFLWQGDYRLIIGIIKHLEDKMNVEHDTKSAGVQSIILIEDDIRYYSLFLPAMYSEILEQSRRLIAEGLNLSHKYLRMRARPKILLCTTYEEAWNYFQQYEEHILGVISDVDFFQNEKQNPRAGIAFAHNVKEKYYDIPVLLQSHSTEHQREAQEIGASFLAKNSETLLRELREFIFNFFSFGDFIFRTTDGTQVGIATDLQSLEENLRTAPIESVLFHAERNHFSRWLKARTEFLLAYQLRPRQLSDYLSEEAMRDDLVSCLRSYRSIQRKGLIADYVKETFDPQTSFARIGGGSLGGKARGLGFINVLLNMYDIRNKFSGVEIFVPTTVVLGTEVFDKFLDMNELRTFALSATNDEEITETFLRARKFPEEILQQLFSFLEMMREPLAVRSSSLLEDSQYHPFAGVYRTYMIPNNHSNTETRLEELLNTIKRVYASTFFHSAKEYIKATSYRLEEEKMAVIIQKMLGAEHSSRFYPDISGVAKSYNFYPLPPQKPLDGIISVALGLGKIIVDGGITVRFCPKYPAHLLQFHSAEESLRNNQTEFFALHFPYEEKDFLSMEDALVHSHTLDVAELDGTLAYVGSTYSPDNDAVYDGISKQGIRLVTFAPVLRNKIFPLPQILELILEIGSWGMGTPVEIEFAVNLSLPSGKSKQFGLLQMRPLVLGREFQELSFDDVEKNKILCESNQILGNGVNRDIYDIIVVDIHRFERARSRETAREVALFNEKLCEEKKPYVLIGVGRWGTLDSWLGIPVTWDQISAAKVIVETPFKDMDVEPSQGSHFFQNITSFMVGYFSINPKIQNSFIDWKWLSEQNAAEEKIFTRHLSFSSPLVVKMNAHQNKGVILKPE